SGAGALRFSAHVNFERTRTDALEDVRVTARWLADKSGTARLEVSGGDLGTVVGRYVECWGPTFEQVYLETNIGCGVRACEDGDRARCSIPPEP
ncbi:MAG: hypothetical protein ACK4N5_25485, partial [Myxococcales bacterium]